MIQSSLVFNCGPLMPTSQQGLTLLNALQRGERLTVALALERYGVYALSQRMGELRRLGWPVQSSTIALPNGKRVKEYRL